MSIRLSINVNSRNIFCLGWKSDTSLATQNKRNLVGENNRNSTNYKQLNQNSPKLLASDIGERRGGIIINNNNNIIQQHCARTTPRARGNGIIQSSFALWDEFLSRLKARTIASRTFSQRKSC